MLRILLTMILLALAPAASAQAYPQRPLRLLVGFAPGGANDLLARLIAPLLSQALGQPVVVENRAGSGGNLASDQLAKAAADGHTLLMGSTGPQGIAPTLYSRLPFDPATQVAAVGLVATSGNLVVVSPTLPVSSIAELVALARSRPGGLSYASQGEGSTGHLATELFKRMAGVDLVHVPYKGDSQALPDVISGRVPVLFAGVPPALPHVQAGRLKLLAVTPATRLKALPDVPSVAEAGVPGYDVTTWYGLFVTGGTDPAIVRRLAREVGAIVSTPHVQSEIARLGMQAASSGTPEEFSRFVARDVERWGTVIRAIGARAD